MVVTGGRNIINARAVLLHRRRWVMEGGMDANFGRRQQGWLICQGAAGMIPLAGDNMDDTFGGGRMDDTFVRGRHG